MTEPGDNGLPSFSVAVLSHKRPHLLERVLWGISQLDYPMFEIIVVGDLPRLSAFGLPDFLVSQIKYAHCPDANICRSRNMAIELAAGEVVAFIDDDAVPEPDWLRELARAFVFPDVGGVGGLVRGSDGLKVEWRGGKFDRSGRETTMPMKDDMRVFDADSQVFGNEFVGTLGANSAFRREAVLSVGGFDESYRYFLDETDLMLRLAEAGWDSAIALSAEVHHMREENNVRDGLRTPRNLFEIAASKAYFCRRHMREGDVVACLDKFKCARVSELDPYIRIGLVRRKDRRRLIDQLELGLAEGLKRTRTLPMTDSFAATPFRKFKPLAIEPVSVALVGEWNPFQTADFRRAASRLVQAGFVVSLLSFTSGWRPRTVRYVDGIWLHTGGTWRGDHFFQGRRVIGRRARARSEISRVKAKRRLEVVLSPNALFGESSRVLRLPELARPVHASALGLGTWAFDNALARIAAALENSDMPPKQRGEAAELRQNELNMAS